MNFTELAELLDQDPAAYRREALRMREEDPVAFDVYVRQLQRMLADANLSEDRESARRMQTPAPKKAGYIRRHSSLASLAVCEAKKRGK